jgi:hypothetical protein
MRYALIFAVAIAAGCSQLEAPSTTPSQTAKPQAAAKANDSEQLDNDVKLVDDFLAKWDRFAQGENDLVPEINQSLNSKTH